MSNTEERPAEEVLCTEHGAEPATEPELLLARDVPLGGPRAMMVRRALPNRDRRMVGAWCFADAYGPDDVSRGEGMQVPPHPHTGLQTVSWLVQGAVLHRDSLGSEQEVRPGVLNLMTAGHGIAHSEVSPPVRPATLQGAQLWVALPDRDRQVDPAFETLADLPRLRVDVASVTVMLGSLVGMTSAATTYTPIVGADLELAGGGDAELPVDASFEHAVLALTGGVVVEGVAVPIGAMLYVAPGRTSLRVSAAAVGARALLLGGEPFEEDLVMWWNFVGRTHDDIADARKAWQVERALPAADRVRFGLVDGHDGFTLPAPELPGVALKPRPRVRPRTD